MKFTCIIDKEHIAREVYVRTTSSKCKPGKVIYKEFKNQVHEIYGHKINNFISEDLMKSAFTEFSDLCCELSCYVL